MKIAFQITLFLTVVGCVGQAAPATAEENLIQSVLSPPTPNEIAQVLADLRNLDLEPRDVVIRDFRRLANSNHLFVLSHRVEGRLHYGAVIVPESHGLEKLPVILFAAGGDGIHKELDITSDFNHAAAEYPAFLGGNLDSAFIVVIPSFRGQELRIGDKTFQSEGQVGDAFGGATTDALAFMNVVLRTFDRADEGRMAVYGGSRGGTVALLAAARNPRIRRAIAVAAPTDMHDLYQLYPDQFKLLFFNDLIAGRITESVARKNFIGISPVHFAGELPRIQLHHDRNDPFVPVAFADTLIRKMTALGKPIEAHRYDEGIHGFWSDENFWKRVTEFLMPLTETH